MLDNLGNSTNGECNWRHAEPHGVDHTGSEAFGARRVPENVEAGDCRDYVLDETRGKRCHSTNFDWTVPLASKKDQACTRSCFWLELFGNCREISDALFPCHCAYHAADHAVIWPAELFAPVSWDKRGWWLVDSGMDNCYPLRIYSTLGHRLLYGGRNGNETRYAIPVFEPNGLRNELNAPGDHEWWLFQAHQCHQCYGVRPCIMRVRDVSTKLPHAPAHVDCCQEIPIALGIHRFCVESRRFGATQKRRILRGENERLMLSLRQPRREEENLPLTAAPITS